MRICYLQHVPFEDLANIAVWAAERGHAVSGTQLFAGEPLPGVDAFDLLVVLGGPMNVDEHRAYPWLLEEKRLIGTAIDRGKAVLGICLGAQLAAEVLGAKVRHNPHKEIGWFPVSLTETAASCEFFREFPGEFMAFHWHGDTFEIPAGAVRLAASEACPNQAFRYDAHVLAMQFHLEYSAGSIAKMIDDCGDELTGGPYIQRPEEIAGRDDYVDQAHGLLVRIMDAIQRRFDVEHESQFAESN